MFLWLAEYIPYFEQSQYVQRLRMEAKRDAARSHFVRYRELPDGVALHDILPFPRREANFFNAASDKIEQQIQELLKSKGMSEDVLNAMIDDTLVEERGFWALIRRRIFSVLQKWNLLPIAGRRGT